jgi:hypothetical protein
VAVPSVRDLTDQAGFIFQAEVEQLGASTASRFPASAKTAIVRVTKIIRSPAALTGYDGQRITVELQPPVSLRVGQSAVFFTHGIHYGDGLVVRELGNAPPEPAVESQVNTAVQAGNDSELAQRLAHAELVVSGVASATRRFPVASPAGEPRISEHDPDWWEAVIKIESVEKGALPGTTKSILFPHSIDIAWYRSPKVKEGDRGIWLLHNRDLHGRPVPAHAVVHPLDFRPIKELERVRTLLKRPLR